jgi:4-nitrophenyl phosphatase
VLSGETKKEDVPKSKHQPDVMVDDIGVLADLLE